MKKSKVFMAFAFCLLFTYSHAAERTRWVGTDGEKLIYGTSVPPSGVVVMAEERIKEEVRPVVPKVEVQKREVVKTTSSKHQQASQPLNTTDLKWLWLFAIPLFFILVFPFLVSMSKERKRTRHTWRPPSYAKSGSRGEEKQEPSLTPEQPPELPVSVEREKFSEGILRRMDWHDIERLSADLFKEERFDRVEVFAPSQERMGDGGIDVFFWTGDELSSCIQCKQWSSPVGVESIRSFLGAMVDFKSLSGMFVATGGFTRQASDFAQRHSIEVFDAKRLMDKIRMLDESTRSHLEEKYFVQGWEGKTCPSCGARPLILKHGPKGDFFGCPRHPKCRGHILASQKVDVSF